MGKETIPLFDEQKNEVNKTVFATAIVNKVLELNDKYDIKNGSAIEVDIYYDSLQNTKNDLLLVGDPLTLDTDRTELDSKVADYKRIGTIGNVDLDSWKDFIRVVDFDLQVYEFNDGQGLKHNLPVYQNLDKRKLKRTFIDSSFGIKEDLKNFMIETAIFENWYSVLIEKLEKLIKGLPV